MIGTINGILTEYVEAGYDLSLRQLYYQLVSRNIVENTERSYKNVGNLVSDARMAGRIDWDVIKDRGRETVENPHWSSPADILHTAATQFRVDRWANQPCYMEVMVEKQALEGVLIPVCSEWDVPFTANKGYSSSSAMYEASKRFLKAAEQEKELYVLYLGDHDPVVSGYEAPHFYKWGLQAFRLRLYHLGIHYHALGLWLARNLRQQRKSPQVEPPIFHPSFRMRSNGGRP